MVPSGAISLSLIAFPFNKKRLSEPTTNINSSWNLLKGKAITFFEDFSKGMHSSNPG
jgi:hypothetical protein